MFDAFKQRYFYIHSAPVTENSQLFSELSSRITGCEPFAKVLQSAGKKPLSIGGLNDLGKGLLLGSLSRQLQKPIVVITKSEQDLNRLFNLLGCFGLTNIFAYPQLRPDTFNRNQFIESLSARLSITGKLESGRPIIAGFTGNHLIEPVSLPAEILRLAKGHDISPTGLISELSQLGFERQTKAFEVGEFATRGDIIDVFGIGAAHPSRISFNGNRIENIYLFDPVNGNRIEEQTEIAIAAIKNNAFAPSLAHYLEEHQDDLVICFDHSQDILQSLYELLVASENPELVALDKIIDRLPILFFETLVDPAKPHVNFDFKQPSIYASQIDRLTKDVGKYISEGYLVSISTNKEKSVEQILAEAEISIGSNPALSPYQSGLFGVSEMLKIAILSDEQIFTMVKSVETKSSAKHQRLFMADIARGDYIVHNDHGIGQLVDIQRITVSGIEREYLILEYAKGDKLYVPIDQIDKISKYVSVDGSAPTLSRLSSQTWKKVVTKIKRESHKFAKELLDLYAKRQLKQGIAFDAASAFQEELSDSFAYQETPDQETVIQQILADMRQEKTMDRLLVADVGFGKTEVAIRAAYQAVSSGYQVAVLAPTTILVEQHFKTFTERLDQFKTKVAALSRFKSKAEQDDVVQKVKLGQVDVVIGTHRLLSKDVKFKNLGLVIIDEEQRFGVSHKEKLKLLRAEVDVLSLTATPIPRTLNLALSGIRDISVIETAPTNRLPIITTVAPVSNQLIKDAIEREIKRGGQVYFIHNRVRTIDTTQHKLETLLPEVKFIHAHGQMGERLLAKIMKDFNQHQNDVLIASTIIENGIDNPNVNTLIVDDAGHFGLSQLHQLRGRVGRGQAQGYAYFLYNKGKMSPRALERLKTIQDNTDLGSGYNIAMRDMQIRGAGGVLSKSQHGHITAIGLSLYTKLLNKAIEELKTGKKIEVSDVTIDIPVSAYLPIKYVDAEGQRLKIYQTLGVIENTEELAAEFKSITTDYGPLPTEVENLQKLLQLKIAALKTQVVASIIGKNLNPPNLPADNLITINLTVATNPKMLEPIMRAGYPIQVGEKDIKIRHAQLGADWVQELAKMIGLLTSPKT